MSDYADQYLSEIRKETEEREQNNFRSDRRREYDRERRYDDSRSDQRNDRWSNKRYHDKRNDRDYGRSRDGRSDHGRTRMRSRSPPHSYRRRGRYQDRSDVKPINAWDRSKSRWDIRPKGYEDISADVAKLSGIFPSPSNPRPDMEQLNKSLKLAAEKGATGITQVSSIMSKAADSGRLLPSRSKNSRMVLVSSDQELAAQTVLSDISTYLSGLENGLFEKSSLIQNAELSADGRTVCVEFASNEIATVAVALTGKRFGDTRYEIKRPNNYIEPTESSEVVNESPSSKLCKDSRTKLVIMNLPAFLEDSQVRELLTAFGELEHFLLVKNKEGQSEGVAFAEFKKKELLNAVCQGLSGTVLGENGLIVKPACKGLEQDADVATGKIEDLAIKTNSTSFYPGSTVLQLLNMITHDDISDDAEYYNIISQVQEACDRFNGVNGPVQVKIPRKPLLPESFQARVYVKFGTTELCKDAMRELSGRQFSERKILTAYYDEEQFIKEIFI